MLQSLNVIKLTWVCVYGYYRQAENHASLFTVTSPSPDHFHTLAMKEQA